MANVGELTTRKGQVKGLGCLKKDLAAGIVCSLCRNYDPATLELHKCWSPRESKGRSVNVSRGEHSTAHL